MLTGDCAPTNHVVTGPPLQNFGQVTSAYRDQANTQDPGGRLVQLVSRISW